MQKHVYMFCSLRGSLPRVGARTERAHNRAAGVERWVRVASALAFGDLRASIVRASVISTIRHAGVRRGSISVWFGS